MFRACFPGCCALVLLTCAAGCVPSSTPFVLEAVHGRVVDLQTGEPIAGAEVVEWYFGGGPSDGARPVHHARWATSNRDGAFVLAESRASVRMIASSSYGPKYVFVHTEYGLQRQAREIDGRWILQGDKRRAEQAHQDLQPYCRGERDDAGARRIREVACDATPSRE